MKQLISFLMIILAAVLLFFTACKGNTGQTGGAQADSGQVHVGNSGPADSNGYKVSPTETGGKDTSGNGVGKPTDTTKIIP
ncbi:hypothetical protein [Mucilaginibacter pedocola]|uniref:Coproporphyrinogen III oxidase n=1 Tax=Mucilaginibacter pedocola TaxID=1792845 RepID=A0A1S9PK40_9SPHI|nr:hypothetical protein [Mucilaginibacter pedocola]OOQ61320.1 hypothetical protein BC343_20270 [Mucilaginibacter pedocola]